MRDDLYRLLNNKFAMSDNLALDPAISNPVERAPAMEPAMEIPMEEPVVDEGPSALGRAVAMGFSGLGDAIVNSYGNGGSKFLTNTQDIFKNADDRILKQKENQTARDAKRAELLMSLADKKTARQDKIDSALKDIESKKEIALIANEAKKEQGEKDRQNKLEIAKMYDRFRGDTLEEKKKENVVKLEEKNRFNDKDVETVTAFDDSKRKMQEVLNMIGDHSNWTGPVDGRLPDYMVDKDQIRFRSELGKIFDKYRVAVTGAGAGQNELAMLEKRIPSETDTFENFKAKAQSFIDSVDEDKKTFLANKTKQGKNTKPFLPQENNDQRMPASDKSNLIKAVIKQGPDKGKIGYFDPVTKQQVGELE